MNQPTPQKINMQGISAETRTYNVVMAACNAAGKHASCLEIYDAMTSAGRAPSTASFNAAILAHCK
jgi:pentatricopeptide repeat protein